MKKLLSQLLSVLVLCLFLCGCVDCSVSPEPHKTVISTETAYTGLKVHFVDVGQGDCILLESDGSFALIDAGEYSEASRVISYLSSQGAETLDYIFATHPHSDHCGSLAEVIRSFDCKVLVSPDAGADSAAWEYVLDAADERGVTFETPDAFDTYSLGGATVTVLSPSKDSIYSNLNDYSLVTMVEYGDTSVLLTGDAEKTVEKELLRSGYDLSADVLKCGHHGSNTSSCKEFLDAVSPSVAVISCGEGNDYGHPHREVLERLEERSIPIWRTDQDGTVVMSTDGKSISIKAEQKDGTALTASAAEKEEAKDGNTEIRQYMGNKNSKIFHSSDCKSAARTKEKNKVYFESREQAVLEGYSPCKECNP